MARLHSEGAARADPPRRWPSWIVTALALAVFFGAVVAGAPRPAVGIPCVLVLVAAGLWPRLEPGARVVAWLGASAAVLLVVRLPPIWPLVQLLYLVPASIAILALPALRVGRRWLTLGRLELWPVIAMGGLSAVALFAWASFFGDDLSRALAFLPDWPLWLLGLGLLGFSIVNAILEELVFRGLLQCALGSMLGQGGAGVVAAILLQALLFGGCHLHGVPSGPIGAVMAGSWAILLGWSRHRTGGLLTPTLAHVAADAAIFVVLVSRQL